LEFESIDVDKDRHVRK